MVASILTRGAVETHRRAIDSKTALLAALIVLLALANLFSSVATPLGPEEAGFIAGL